MSAGQAFVQSNAANVDLLTFQRAGESTPPHSEQVVGLLDFFLADGMNCSWLNVPDHVAVCCCASVAQ